jgi:hypothetical protein
MTKVYQQLASMVAAHLNCVKIGNDEWRDKWLDRINEQLDEAPSGSGIDLGTKIDLEMSSSDKLVFEVGFHHMDGNGYYDGWTEHLVIVTPSLQFGFNIKITGVNRNQIKEYLHEIYSYWMNREVGK